MSCDLSLLDAAYVLGALSPADREAFAVHLPGCAECTSAVQEFAGLPGLLAQVDRGDLEPPPPPPFLLPRLVREARTIERRRTWRAVAGAAAASLVIGAGAAWVVEADRDGRSPVALPTSTVTSSGRTTAAALVMTPVDQKVVTATVAPVSVSWGTRLDLTCTWAEVPVDPGHEYPKGDGPAYALVVVTKAGTAEQVATWQALPGKTMRLTGATATRTSDIASVEVRTATGRIVLEAAT